jgi:hypothetical protein
MGWQPDYPGEAKLYAKYILKNKPKAKIGVLYQNDAYGKNYLSGLKTGLGSHASQIVDTESYSVTDPARWSAPMSVRSRPTAPIRSSSSRRPPRRSRHSQRCPTSQAGIR